MTGQAFTKQRVSKSEKVYEALKGHITSPNRVQGERLVSTRNLAQMLNTSTFPIYQAIQRLEHEGYVASRHGAGTFVASRYRPLTMADTVTLCMDARGHLWPDLATLLLEALADRGQVGILLGMESQHADGGELIQRIAHSESDTLIVQAGGSFPFSVFELPGMSRKTVISVVSWASGRTWPGLYRVLHDREGGARLVVEHLRSRGHRRVLALGTPTQVSQLSTDATAEICPAYPFARQWEAAGGTWVSMASLQTAIPGRECLDEDALLAVLDATDGPTAIFGLRDYESWLAQGILVHRRPELLSRVEIVGYGNTPWSQSSHFPFSSVDYDFTKIIGETVGIMEQLERGETSATDVIRVLPQLIVRENN